MLRAFLSAAHGLLKGYQDRLSRRRQDHPGRQLAKVMARARGLGIPLGPRLDIGSGQGEYRQLLADTKGPVLELDRFGGPHVDVIGDAHHLPVRNGVTGLTVLAEVLEHLADPAVAVQECYRVLRSGGMLIITTPQYWHVHGHPSDYYRFTDAGLRHLCERAGFSVIDCWSRGGPILIIFHVIRVNLSERWRPLFVLPFYALAEWIDRLLYNSRPTGTHYDALGWSVLARKP